MALSVRCHGGLGRFWGYLGQGQPTGAWIRGYGAYVKRTNNTDDGSTGGRLSSSGYVPCGCRDCIEIAMGQPGDLCHECEESGCEPDSECQAPGAYGGDDAGSKPPRMTPTQERWPEDPTDGGSR